MSNERSLKPEAISPFNCWCHKTHSAKVQYRHHAWCNTLHVGHRLRRSQCNTHVAHCEQVVRRKLRSSFSIRWTAVISTNELVRVLRPYTTHSLTRFHSTLSAPPPPPRIERFHHVTPLALSSNAQRAAPVAARGGRRRPRLAHATRAHTHALN